ncbi:hypothetical protein SB782_35215, partial [Brevibacillus sp. SIMBA_076]|uniref:hypothetical protein n=1 Tax=Brevibacillus sp. SIMBA_076 TaxID=3085814 RepID=UPI00397975FB
MSPSCEVFWGSLDGTTAASARSFRFAWSATGRPSGKTRRARQSAVGNGKVRQRPTMNDRTAHTALRKRSRSRLCHKPRR